jgi:benzoyl-CoA reductase/2-hydroxyglutaryl-CoA dehydratase subunit BcrC/BadD/HgdB
MSPGNCTRSGTESLGGQDDVSKATALLRDLLQAYTDPDAVADRCLRAGHAVVRYLGADFPRELFIAAGVIPIRLALEPRTDHGEQFGTTVLDARGRALLSRLSQRNSHEAFAITHADHELAQLFAKLRELGPPNPFEMAWIEMIDRLHLPQQSSVQYNLVRLRQLAGRLRELAGDRLDAEALRAAIRLCNEQRRAVTRLDAARRAGKLSGAQMLTIVGAAGVLPPQEYLSKVTELAALAGRLPARSGWRVFLTGSCHDDVAVYDVLEAQGALVAGEDHDSGVNSFVQELDEVSDPWHVLAQPLLRPPLPLRSTRRSRALQREIAECAAEAVVHVAWSGDDAAAWEAALSRQVSRIMGLPWRQVGGDAAAAHWRDVLARFVAERSESTTYAASAIEREKPERKAPPAKSGIRSRKSLESLAGFGRYQREWFAGIRERAAKGEPFAVANANAPQEILRAFDIPFVVNQWWASIVAAKQQSGRYAGLLQQRGFPVTAEAYSAQGLAACFDVDEQNAPWGGLPRPAVLVAVTSSDATLKIFEAWAEASGAKLELFERSVDCRKRISPQWWDELPTQWDAAIEAERLDLMEAELRSHIDRLERLLGRKFPHERFRKVMELVNEQEDWYRKTRDLIAASERAPVGIADTMPATMVPQWHRGTLWGRDAARAFHDEVAARVAHEDWVCPNERIRLMWVGRGMWSEMGFYQQWEQSHGAVFVWSMYLALAADGYIRTFDRGRNPIRALAARFVTMGDELRMPTWGGAWHVHEARTHRVDGIVALSDADPFVVRALREAGFPVLVLDLDNFSKDAAGSAAAERRITEFIEGPVLVQARLRGH